MKYFNGMWSFAIWDLKKKNFSYQEIPLVKNHCIIIKISVVSFLVPEIKFVKSLCSYQFKINDNQIYKNLFLGYKSLNKSEETFYKDIYSLRSGTNLILDLNLKIKKLNIGHKN